MPKSLEVSKILCSFAQNTFIAMNIGNYRFFGEVPRHSISLDDLKVFIADDGNAKRIHFATSHAQALRLDAQGPAYGWLNLPFCNTIEPLLKQEVGKDFMMFSNRATAKKYRRINSEAEYLKIQAFIEKYKNVVFLRDCLDLSISLSMNMSEPGVRTELGDLEHKIKYKSNEINYGESISKITKYFQEALGSLPYFKNADYICAVPSSHSFMKEVANGLLQFGFNNISNNVTWSKTAEIKNALSPDEKLGALLDSNLQLDQSIDLNGKSILLIDDLYNSGLTMQYVAKCLKQLGASYVFGMTLVKSLSNT